MVPEYVKPWRDRCKTCFLFPFRNRVDLHRLVYSPNCDRDWQCCDMHPPEGICRRLMPDCSALGASCHTSSTAPSWLLEEIYQLYEVAATKSNPSSPTCTSEKQSTVQSDANGHQARLMLEPSRLEKCPCVQPRTLRGQSSSTDGPQARSSALFSATDLPSVVPKSGDFRAKPVF